MATLNLLSKSPAIRKTKEVSSFSWRTGGGEHLPVSQMGTSHLFYTLKMIWNHSAPPQIQIHPYQKYDFGDFYTNDYIAQAVRCIANELFQREDLAPSFQIDLDFMRNNVHEFNTYLLKGN